jgi:hypothetical protein
MTDAIAVCRYRDDAAAEWDAFVGRSTNGTFLFRRRYMDYHRDRFADHSLMIRGARRELLAVLPANRTHDCVTSHGGLSYGGFVTGDEIGAAAMLAVMQATCEALRADGVRELVLKPVPYIYHRAPAGEMEYAIFRHGGVLFRRDVTTTVVPAAQPAWQSRRLRAVKKARAAGVRCAPSDDFARCWDLVTENLAAVHGLVPVHSLDEIRRLQAACPDEIKLFAAFAGSRMLSAVVIYETARVAHAQYTANSAEGRECGALDLLFHYLLSEVYAAKPYFDFGVSTENDGRYLNEGLVGFKEGFGGRTITLDFYRLMLA